MGMARSGLVWFDTGPVPATVTTFSRPLRFGFFLRRSDLLEHAATHRRWVVVMYPAGSAAADGGLHGVDGAAWCRDARWM